MPWAPKPRCKLCQRRHAKPGKGYCHNCLEKHYGREWKALRSRRIKDHLRRYGNMCPGWGVAPHEADRLTVDHIVPVTRGGRGTWSNTQVLCFACNTRKSNTRGTP